MLNWISDLSGSRGVAPPEADGAGARGVQSPGMAFELGLLAGTEVATANGWTPVEILRVGEEVLTFDAGPQPLRTVTRRLYPRANNKASGALIHVPAGVIGNRSSLMLLPDQGVMLESDLAEQVWGDPFAMVAARELCALPGVGQLLPDAPIVAVTLSCEADEVLFANGQALIHCPARASLAPASIEEALWGPEPSRYRLLNAAEARLLTSEMRKSGQGPSVSVA